VRISMCHCLACQRRTGSAFGMQARWPKDRVDVTGRYTEHVRISDAREERTFRFCPDCGATVFWTTEGWPDSIAVPIGAFADPSFPQPTVSVYGSRGYPWLSLPDGIEEEHDYAPNALASVPPVWLRCGGKLAPCARRSSRTQAQGSHLPPRAGSS
jgi:hypothetical protein